MNIPFEKSFENIIIRNKGNKGNKRIKKTYEYELFTLNSCRYFAAYSYLDYIENNYKKYTNYTKEEINTFIKYIAHLPYTLNKQIKPFSDFNIYTFDSSFDNIRNNKAIICYIYKKTYDGINTIHTFILENDIIYNSWLTKESTEIKKLYTIDELKGKRKYDDEQEKCSVLMPPTKVYVDNVYNKLKRLLKNPSILLLKQIFGLGKEHILTKINENDFKDAEFKYLMIND
jgi:hypothetical protein